MVILFLRIEAVDSGRVGGRGVFLVSDFVDACATRMDEFVRFWRVSLEFSLGCGGFPFCEFLQLLYLTVMHFESR